ncbi:hypothetical protein G6F65_014196 [Rhizopus arrhizus]|nr:hypothetical protein G6F65_014196 [Rhizopus arrhizus]
MSVTSSVQVPVAFSSRKALLDSRSQLVKLLCAFPVPEPIAVNAGCTTLRVPLGETSTNCSWRVLRWFTRKPSCTLSMLRAPLASWKVRRAAAAEVLPMVTVRVVVRQPLSTSGPSDWKFSATSTARAALTTPKPYQLL